MTPAERLAEIAEIVAAGPDAAAGATVQSSIS
jgi:hypothetical protein